MKYPTVRALITGALFIIVSGYWHQQSTHIAHSTDMQAIAPPVSAMAFLLILIFILNPLLGLVKKALRYNVAELVTIFTMVIIGTPLAGTGWAQAIFPSRTAPRYYAAPENKYEQDFFAYIKDWFGPTDAEAIRGFYEGGMPIPWLAWLPTLLTWGLFSLVLYFSFVCLVVLVKKQWIERERLSFPLLKAPLELLQGVKDNKHGLMRNKLTWIGISLPVALHIVNGLNAYFPGVPAITTSIDLSRFFLEHPWDAMGGLDIYLNPMACGVSYLMPLEISFSFWFFNLFFKVLNVVAAAMAWNATGTESAMAGFPYQVEQRNGAFIALALIYFWMMRRQLKGSWRAAWSSLGREGEKVRKGLGVSVDEAREYRVAWSGLIGGWVFILSFIVVMGMSLWAGALFFLLVFIHALVFSRMRAEAGLPPVYLDDTPTKLMTTMIDPRSIGNGNLTNMAFFGWISQDLRGSTMPNLLDGMKLNQGANSKLRSMMLVMVIAIIVGIGIGIYSELALCYNYGHNSLCTWRRYEGHKHFMQLSEMINQPPKQVGMPKVAVGFGALITVLLAWLRTRFLWWPFHPIGYAVTPGFSYVFVGWLARLVIFQLGGSKLYRRALPFFLGLIIGDFAMRVFWGALGSFVKAGYGMW